MAELALSARIREEKGKGTARKLRVKKFFPAIFYGPNTQPLSLSIKYSDFQAIVAERKGEHIILDLIIESDNERDKRTVMVKELQIDPIKNTYLHADFYEISMDRELSIDVPVRLINTPIGVTQGGILQQLRREVTISALPNKLVAYLELDVSGLEIGQSIHIRDINLPEGLKMTQEENETIAVVVAPALVVEKAEEVEEEAETEEGKEKTGPEETGE
jgi:large subunit ribosomal protein L25